MNPTASELGAEVMALCRGLGFALAGVCDAGPSDHQPEFRRWLAEGRHGTMEWLGRNVEARLSPVVFLPGVRSLILVADRYAAPGADRAAPAPGAGEARGAIARYARGGDYHTIMKRRLHALCDALRARFDAMSVTHTLRAFVDTAPVLEREHAARARLGWIGKHTLLINPALGSYLLLGGVATSAAIADPESGADHAGSRAPMPDHCGSCTRCIDACPTGAITPYRVDAARCVSYLTIEHRGPIEPALHAGIGAWLFGCDVCQEVCPHNRARGQGETITPHGAYAPQRDGFGLLEVLGWTEEDRRRAFAGSSMKRATLAMMKRNALIVVGNTPARGGEEEAALRARIAKLARDENEPELVRETAREVLGRLEAALGGQPHHGDGAPTGRAHGPEEFQ